MLSFSVLLYGAKIEDMGSSRTWKARAAEMKSKKVFYLCAVVLFFFFLREYEAIPIEELPDSTTCGVYGAKLEPYMSSPFNEKGGTLEGSANGNKVHVVIQRVHTEMCRDKGKFPRYQVEVKFNDRLVLTLSHTDVPFAINAYYNNVKYRVICVDNL
jgi:hypothetical protein